MRSEALRHAALKTALPEAKGVLCKSIACGGRWQAVDKRMTI
jgi:hypothetical protein